MKKRMTSLVLALLMVLTLLPTAAWAEDAVTIVDSGTCGKDGDNLTWTFDSNYVLTISGKGEMADYEMWGTSEAPWKQYENVWVTTSSGRENHSVQEVYIGDGVTYVGDYAFYMMTYVEKVRLPETLTAVGRRSFYASAVTELPRGLVSMGEGAFSGCDFTELTIPQGITEIPNNAFGDCSQLKTVTLHNNITSLGYGVFDYCRALETIEIPESVKTIGQRAFYMCENLKELTIPDSVTYVGFEALHCCGLTKVSIGKNARIEEVSEESIFHYGYFSGGSLVTIEVDPENPYNTVQDNVLFSKDMTELLSFSNGRSGAYKIPATVKTVRPWAFFGCPALTSVVVPDGVETLGEQEFRSCDALETVYLPNSLTSIASGCFYECYALTDIYYSGTYEEWKAIYNPMIFDDECRPDIHFEYELPLDPGNVNGKGGIDATDVQCLMDYLLGMGELTENQLKAADFNQDGVVDVYDVQALYLYLTQQGS